MLWQPWQVRREINYDKVEIWCDYRLITLQYFIVHLKKIMQLLNDGCVIID